MTPRVPPAPAQRRGLTARRGVLLAKTIAGLGVAAFVAAPDFNLTANYPTAQAQNLTDELPSFPTTSYGDILGRRFFVGVSATY